jgi:hypothetical protein
MTILRLLSMTTARSDPSLIYYKRPLIRYEKYTWSDREREREESESETGET